MPNHNYTTQSQAELQEDEIDLRELFATIGRYKWSIFFTTFIITAIVVVFAYRMPKYYKTTTVIEVKPKAGDKGGFSLGGAGALLGLGGGSASSTEKDAALMAMFRANQPILNPSFDMESPAVFGDNTKLPDTSSMLNASNAKLGTYQTNNSNLSIQNINYAAQYYTYQKYRYTELTDNNCSIMITGIQIPDYKNFGMEVIFKSLSPQKFSLSTPSLLGDEFLGEYSYGQKIHTAYFDLKITKRECGATPAKIKLNADTHYIFDTIISKNLSTAIDKANPFITISYLDTIPARGEAYVQKLIDNYVGLSISFEIEDADITLGTLNKQISEIEAKVKSGASKMEKFKSNKKIFSPATQAQVLIRGKEKSTEQLIQVNYQLDLLRQLIRFAKTNKNIDAIAPTLTELQDQPTIALITKLQSLQLDATSLAQEFKPAYPKLKSTRSQIRSIKSKIRSNLKNLQKTLQARAKSLEKVQKTYARQLRAAPTAEREMTELLREYKYNEKLYIYLLQKRSAAEIKKAEAMSRFRTIEPIYTKPTPAKPKKALIAIVGFITALILSIFMAFFREFLRKDYT